MIRPAVLTLALFALLAPAAQAAPKSCTREGGRLLAASGSVRVVAVKEKRQRSDTRRERIYGCWTSTGRRFTLFQARDAGLDSIERDRFEIVDGRYIGAIRHFEGGASESRIAGTWDAQKAKAVFNTKPCDGVSAGDFGGVIDAVFFRNGGIAYTCWQRSRIVDGKGDRALEPDGTQVTNLAISRNSHWFGERLYYTVNETLVKALTL
ncbi:hypothetical protein DVA67_014465 [Solirubrobacter sp. CPCC 204708]|uniref:Uncharacterized protein n=1 Tax=Solirubrobacter deserti TaxID=2282478 RepID=A0ABT4RC68_9ACTN|nr:hypothetical protein [Solirubrobacter deserti]MBE2317182.1 hypothetical protein [Solirubrobacter deserti]MDA0135925.1 hypothetical protein [Solirubrobacter deserti]